MFDYFYETFSFSRKSRGIKSCGNVKQMLKQSDDE